MKKIISVLLIFVLCLGIAPTFNTETVHAKVNNSGHELLDYGYQGPGIYIQDNGGPGTYVPAGPPSQMELAIASAVKLIFGYVTKRMVSKILDKWLDSPNKGVCFRWERTADDVICTGAWTRNGRIDVINSIELSEY